MLDSIEREVGEEQLGLLLGAAAKVLRPGAEDGNELPEVSQALPGGKVLELAGNALRSLSERSALLIVFEDLHWADETTRELFAYLARGVGHRPILLVGTYRSDELHRRHPLLPFVAQLHRSIRPERLELARFTRDETERLIEDIVVGEPDGELIRAVWTCSEGNAFFVEELLTAAGAQAAVPETLREVILARTAELSNATTRVLKVASLDRVVRPDLLADVAESEPAVVEGALEVLTAAGFLVPRGDAYEFRHALTREIVYEALPPGQGPRRHASAAESTARRYPNATAQLARHYVVAGNQPAALTALVAAGHGAIAMGAPAEGYEHLRRALDLWDVVVDSETRVGRSWLDVAIAAGDAAATSYRGSEAVALAERALERLDESDLIGQARVWSSLAMWRWDAGVPGRPEAAERALELLPADAPLSLRLAALLRAAAASDWLYRVDREEELASEAFAVAQLRSDRLGGLVAELMEASARAKRGDVDAISSAALDAALDGDGVPYLSAIDDVLAMNLRLCARHNEVVAVADEGLSTLIEHGFGPRSADLNVILIFSLQRLGRWEEADLRARELIDRVGEAFLALWPDGLGWSWARILVRRGELEEAWRRLEPGFWNLQRFPELTMLTGGMAAAYIELAAVQGRFDDARFAAAFVSERSGEGRLPSGAEAIATAIMIEADRVHTSGGESRGVCCACRTLARAASSRSRGGTPRRAPRRPRLLGGRGRNRGQAPARRRHARGVGRDRRIVAPSRAPTPRLTHATELLMPC